MPATFDDPAAIARDAASRIQDAYHASKQGQIGTVAPLKLNTKTGETTQGEPRPLMGDTITKDQF